MCASDFVNVDHALSAWIALLVSGVLIPTAYALVYAPVIGLGGGLLTVAASASTAIFMREICTALTSVPAVASRAVNLTFCPFDRV